jgi:pSer/pThr/pTyr-binding forkhead associated (FHA) protein
MTDFTGGNSGQSGVEARLVVVDGAERGQEFALDRDIVTIGRGADNDIVINDIGSSRKHAKVVREGESYRLVDLGSGNGTFMNGVAVKEETLRPGSLFRLGGTIFRFVRAGDVYATDESLMVTEQAQDLKTQPPMETVPINIGKIRGRAEAKRTRSVLIYGVIALVLFLGAAVLVKFALLQPEEEQKAVGAQHQSAGDKARMHKAFDEGIEAFKRQDWTVAGERFKEVLAADPQDERARRYQAKVDDEKAGNEAVVKAGDLLAKGMNSAAIELLKKVPQDSYYGGQASALLSKAQDALASAAQNPPDEPKAGNADGAGAQPGGGDKKPVIRGDKPLTGEKPDKTNGREKPDRGGKPAAGGKDSVLDGFGGGEEPAAKPEPVMASGPTADKAVAMFRKGDVAGAIEVIETDLPGSDSKADKLLSELKSFKAALAEGEGYYKSKQDEGAVRALSRALQAAKSIAPAGENAYIPKINAMLADMYFLRGMKAFYKDNYLVAVQNFQTALKFKPDHQQSQAKLSDVANAAGKIYEEAYVLKSADPEAARKKFEMIIQITPPTNEYNKKSKEWLKRL